MIPSLAARLRNPAAIVAVSLACLGCQIGEPAEETKLDYYKAMTTGTPESRRAHMSRLTETYLQAEPSDPSTARKLLDVYAKAAAETAKSIFDDPSADSQLREEAVGAYFTALSRRKQIDPKFSDKIIAAANQIEAENPKTKMAVMAAFERARIYREQSLTLSEAEAGPKIRQWGEEVLHIGQMTPTSPLLPTILDELGQKTEYFGYSDLAEKLYRTLVDRFPDDENSKFARGVLYRMSLKGQPLTELEGPGRDGKTVSSRDFLGKVVLVDFWATGCQPCLAEMPALEQLRTELKPRGMALLSVALDPNSEDVERFLQMAKLDWPVIFANTSAANMESPMTLKYGIKAIPFKFVIDREGNLAASGYRLEDIRPTLERLLLIPEIPGAVPPPSLSPVSPASESLLPADLPK